MAPFGASRAGLMSVAEDDIPDSGLWLDDFANDPTLTSNQITDRSTYSDLAYQFDPPEPSEFDGLESRQDWDAVEGDADNWTVDGGQIFFEGTVSSNHNLASSLPETVSEGSLVTLRWEFEDAGSIDEDGGVTIAKTNNPPSPLSPGLDEGYIIRISDAGSIEIRETTNNDVIISGSYPSDDETHIAELEIDLDTNELELFVNGSSEGSTSDSRNTSFDYVGFGTNDGGTWNPKTNRIEVF